MFNDLELWVELHPRERLVLLGLSLCMERNGGKPVPFRRLLRTTGILRKRLVDDLGALEYWGFVKASSSSPSYTSFILAGKAARSPLMPKKK